MPISEGRSYIYLAEDSIIVTTLLKLPYQAVFHSLTELRWVYLPQGTSWHVEISWRRLVLASVAEADWELWPAVLSSVTRNGGAGRQGEGNFSGQPRFRLPCAMVKWVCGYYYFGWNRMLKYQHDAGQESGAHIIMTDFATILLYSWISIESLPSTDTILSTFISDPLWNY